MKSLIYFLTATLIGNLLTSGRLVACGPAPDREVATRPRSSFGHLRLAPFSDLYELYVDVFVPAAADYHISKITGQLCMISLQDFRENGYKLRSLDQIVMLDACLGYLYESQSHKQDKEDSQMVANNLDYWMHDERLRSMYSGTRISDLPEEARNCLAGLLHDLITAGPHKPEDQHCNQNSSETLLRFADCRHSLGSESGSEPDSYLVMVDELARRRASHCLDAETRRFVELVTVRGDQWAPEQADLLEAVTGLQGDHSNDRQPLFRRLNELIRGQRPQLDVVARHLSSYAASRLPPTQTEDGHEDDESTGGARYAKLMDPLCSEWLASGAYEPDYAGPLLRALRMLQWPEVFGMNEAQFVELILGGESGQQRRSVYFSVAACQLVAASEAHDSRRMGPYEVRIDPDKLAAVWPDASVL